MGGGGSKGTMDCREVEELAGAMALGAVPAEEAAAVREHLRTCPNAHQLLQELQEVASLLPLTVPEVEPPVSLKGRLLAAARTDAAPPSRPGPTPLPPPAQPR